MVTVSVVGTSAVFDVQGADKLWSLRSRLEIPLAHIRDVRPAPEMPGWLDWLSLDGVKVVGAHLPGVIAAGTFYHKDGWVFWDVHDAAKAIEIVLDHEEYSRLVVEVADPQQATAALNAARR